jgi:hypothetical protein
LWVYLRAGFDDKDVSWDSQVYKVTRKVNGGTTHLKNRKKYFHRALQAWPEVAPTVAPFDPLAFDPVYTGGPGWCCVTNSWQAPLLPELASLHTCPFFPPDF